MEQLFSDTVKIHKQGFIHNDLKLGNILLSSDNKGNYVIIDYGLAISKQAAKTTKITGCTPSYLPFEIEEKWTSKEDIILAEKPERLDVYAMGKVFFRILFSQEYYEVLGIKSE